jgi:hypothetical protein
MAVATEIKPGFGRGITLKAPWLGRFRHTKENNPTTEMSQQIASKLGAVDFAWNTILGTAQEARMIIFNEHGQLVVARRIERNLLGSSDEASAFWTSMFRIGNIKALTISVTDRNANGQDGIRQITVEARQVGSNIYGLPVSGAPKREHGRYI